MYSPKMKNETTSRGRPRAYDAETALEAAMLTFWEQGYHATSIDDLVARTGASRGSLYKTFGDKKDVFVKCLELYGARFEARAETLIAAERDVCKIMERLLTASAERLTSSEAPAGCLRCNSTLELAGWDEKLDQALQNANDRYLAVVSKVIKRGVADGQLDSSASRTLPIFFCGVVAGMVTLSRSGTSRDELMTIVSLSLGAFDQYLSKLDTESSA